MIEQLRADCPAPVLCRQFSVSLSGYSRWRSAPPSPRQNEETRLEVEISAAHKRIPKIYGAERHQEDLASHGVEVGIHRVERIRRKFRLRCKQKKKFKATTNSRHDLPVAANLVDQVFQATRPSQIWLGDITYIATDAGWLYLAGYKDIFTGEIVGIQ